MRGQKRTADEEEEEYKSSASDTPKSGDESLISRSKTKTPKSKVTKKKKAKMDHEAKTTAAFDRLCGIAEKAFMAPSSSSATVTVADPRIDRLELKMEEQSSQLSSIITMIQGMQGKEDREVNTSST